MVNEANAPNEPQRWLLLIYRVPQQPPGRRTAVWRQLKQLGAIYLQQAAGILPDRPQESEALAALAERILGFEGEVSLLRTVSPSASWEADIVCRFNDARAAEFGEFVENVERFEDELRRESRKGKFTFAELEENEADYERLERWFTRILDRDFFGSPLREEAKEALIGGRRTLEVFASQVYAHEDVQEESPK
jgi:hypothetical protein